MELSKKERLENFRNHRQKSGRGFWNAGEIRKAAGRKFFNPETYHRTLKLTLTKTIANVFGVFPDKLIK